MPSTVSCLHCCLITLSFKHSSHPCGFNGHKQLPCPLGSPPSSIGHLLIIWLCPIPSVLPFPFGFGSECFNIFTDHVLLLVASGSVPEPTGQGASLFLLDSDAYAVFFSCIYWSLKQRHPIVSCSLAICINWRPSPFQMSVIEHLPQLWANSAIQSNRSSLVSASVIHTPNKSIVCLRVSTLPEWQQNRTCVHVPCSY